MTAQKPDLEVVPDPEEGRQVHHLRGKEYVVVEMESDPYEKIWRQATTVDEDGNSTTDMLMLERLLLLNAVTVDGKQLDNDAWGKEKRPVVAKIGLIARRMNWADLETDEERKAREADEKKQKAISPNA